MRRALLPLLVPAVIGCAPDFEPASTLSTLRVLAVQKDKPYAKPGDTVNLRILVTDASEKAPRPIQILWLGGFCENPLADLYAGCFVGFQDGSMGASTGPLGLPAGIVVGEGPTYSVPISRNIISRRPRPVNPKQPPYGVSYVFFVACAGTVAPNPNALPKSATGHEPTESFPLACFGKDNERIGPEGFVAGYTELFAYDELTNENPVVTGFQVDGQDVTPECIGAACIESQLPVPVPEGGVTLIDAAAPSAEAGLDAALAEAGITGSGGRGGGSGGSGSGGAKNGSPKDPCDQNSPACLPVCPKNAKESDCEHTIKLVVDSASVEADGAAVAIEGRAVFEQLWINHYAERGKIARDVKLLGDATLGYQEAHETKIVAPRTTGTFHVWAVAHDNRGGTEWARVLLSAQ